MVCLEQGEWSDTADYMSAEPEAELAWHEKWNPTRTSAATRPTIRSPGDADIHPTMYNGVGGGLVQWAAMWQNLLPSDFRVRTLDGVADDWPIGWNDLAPFYDRAARGHVGVGAERRPRPSRSWPTPTLRCRSADREWPPPGGWTAWDGTGGRG